jgi:hypothetical protein
MNIQRDITTCILGAKGSGKSVLLAAMLHNYKGKAVLFDLLGVFNPKNSFKTAIVPHSYYCTDVDSFLSNFKHFPDNAKIIVSLENYLGDELIQAVDSICKFLMDNRTKIAVLSDEIADIMPNNARGSKEFHRMVKNGRNYGIRPVIFATQRPQSVSKSIFDLCDKFYISSQKAPRTIDYIIDILDTVGNDDIKQRITALQQREFLIYDGDLRRYKVPFYKYAFKQ